MESKKRTKKQQAKEEESEDEQFDDVYDEGVSSEEEEITSLQKVEPRLPKTQEERQTQPRLIVVLEDANLETAKTKRGIELINCDDHQKLIGKMKKQLEDYRPDVTHQCLLALLDSPLNKAGLLQVYIKTKKNQLIEINPQIRIPRTFKRFSGLMAQLLTKLKIRASTSSTTLMKIIKNPVTDHLPIGVRKIGTSSKAPLVHMGDFIKKLGVERKPIVFVIGAVSVGNPGMENDYVDESICVSSYSLSAACVCSKVCTYFEDLWKVL